MSEGGKSGNAFSWLLNFAFAVFAVVLAIVLAQAGLGFGQQLLVAVLLIVGGSQLSKLTRNSLPDFHWPIFAKGVGWIFLVAVLVNSSFVQRPLQVISETEAAVAQDGLEGLKCPDASQTAKVNGVYTLKRRCGDLRLTGLLPKGVTYQVLQGSGDPDFEDNLAVSRPFPNVRIFSIPEIVPDGTDITFRIVSQKESEELDRIGM